MVELECRTIYLSIQLNTIPTVCMLYGAFFQCAIHVDLSLSFWLSSIEPSKRQVSLKALTIDSALKWEQIQKNHCKTDVVQRHHPLRLVC